MVRAAWWVALSFASLGCSGSTGGDVVEFQAFAAGPPDAIAGQTYSFQTGRGYGVHLTRARIHMGAVYLNRSVQTSVGDDTSCMLAGTYVAEVTSGLDVDVLSPELQAFPSDGVATSDEAKTGEVWLTGGDVNAENDATVILYVEGSAEKDGVTFPFDGAVTIGSNRALSSSDQALPGAKPMCKQRIVSPIPVDVRATRGGQLVVRVDPRGIFANVECSAMAKSADDPSRYRFRDDGSDQPSRNLFYGLRAGVGTYSFGWEVSP